MYHDHGARCWLLLSLASLTHQAFTINMELRMLARAGTMPRRVCGRTLESRESGLATVT